MQVNALARYPVKSCRGIALRTAQVLPWGLAGDRRWMLVDAAGKCITAREHPRLVLVDVELLDASTGPGAAAGLRLRFAGQSDLIVAEPAPDPRLPITIWNDTLPATPAADEAHAWFSELLGLSARLVFLDDPRRRPVDPAYGAADDVVSFADGYPLLLTSVESLAAVNDLVRAGRWADEAPLPMTRFRPSVVVEGAPAWAEDGWRRIRIGAVTFRVARGCARCVLTTIDPDTAQKGKEPLFTLARHRNWDGKVWFGANLIPEVHRSADLTAEAYLHLGDPVEVLQ